MHKCSLLIFLHTCIACMSVKTSLLFFSAYLIDFSGTTRIIILVFFLQNILQFDRSIRSIKCLLF